MIRNVKLEWVITYKFFLSQVIRCDDNIVSVSIVGLYNHSPVLTGMSGPVVDDMCHLKLIPTAR